MDNGNNNTAQRRSIIGGTAAFVRESLRDSDADYTKGPIRRALGLLAAEVEAEVGRRWQRRSPPPRRTARRQRAGTLASAPQAASRRIRSRRS